MRTDGRTTAGEDFLVEFQRSCANKICLADDNNATLRTYETMSVSLSRPTYIVLASSSFVVVTWRLLQWRARKRAKKTVERVKKMVKEGAPLVSKVKKQKK
jgi:hypothetical protein